jgi:hypothetical protein
VKPIVFQESINLPSLIVFNVDLVVGLSIGAIAQHESRQVVAFFAVLAQEAALQVIQISVLGTSGQARVGRRLFVRVDRVHRFNGLAIHVSGACRELVVLIGASAAIAIAIAIASSSSCGIGLRHHGTFVVVAVVVVVVVVVSVCVCVCVSVVAYKELGRLPNDVIRSSDR